MSESNEWRVGGPRNPPFSTMADRYQEQLQQDSVFLCSDQRVGTELLDRLVLQLNRIYPQILTDREAQKFRNLSVPAATRLAELLSHLQEKGEEACHEFYRALHLHSEDLYLCLPTRVSRREAPEISGTNHKPFYKERCMPNDRGPLFFLCCFSIALGLALLHYHKEGKIVTGSVLSYTVFELGQHGRHILLSYSETGSKME
ncbi:caspase recruitment domain-containing protein 19-like [Salminus brasiliensis]|uniref:caspase recruitment domain-containing protein 19-like n=1 Tax=Salminus brasiliensis TaxID=930266 RepID=UPI003B834517